MNTCPTCNLTLGCCDCEKPPSAPVLSSPLEWREDEESRTILGYLRGHPETTLFFISLLYGREDRGDLSGAFIPDDEECADHLRNGSVVFLKMRAITYFREFQRKALAIQSALNGPGAAGAQTQALCPEPGIQQIPCGIAVDVDVETGAGGICPYRPTHKAALTQGKWLHVCQMHGARLQQAGIVVKALENT